MEYTDITPDDEREIFQVRFIIQSYSTLMTFPFRECNWVWHLPQQVWKPGFQSIIDRTLNGAYRKATGNLRWPGRLHQVIARHIRQR